MKMTALSLNEPLRNESLSQRVFQILKDAIFAGTLKPGDPIRELGIAKSLEVSQATVRQALVQLAQAGLVVREQNRRTTVTSFSRDEVRDRLNMRISLEELAAVQASTRMQSAERDRLSTLAADLAKTIAAGDHYENVVADIRFHRFIWECSGSAILLTTLDQLTTPLFAFLSVLHQTGLHDLRQTKPHERIVDALRRRDPDRIRREIRFHIEGSYGEFLNSTADRLDVLIAAGR